MKSFVTLQNTTNRTLTYLIQGRRYELTPQGTEGSSMPCSESVANQFLEHFKDNVRVISESETTEYTAPAIVKSTVWLANVTGNPDAPKEIVHGYVKQGPEQGRAIMGPNPDVEPHTVSVQCYAGGGQISTPGPDGQYNCKTGRKKIFFIRPFECKEFPWTIAEQFLGREVNKTLDQPPAVVKARDLRELELAPSMKMELNELRYLHMLMNPTGLHGQNEQEIRADLADEDDGDLAVYKAKYELWKRCFVLAVDPNSAPIKRKQYELFVAKQLKQEAQRDAKTRKQQEAQTPA